MNKILAGGVVGTTSFAAYHNGRKSEQRQYNVKRSNNAKKGWETRRLAKQAMFGIPMGKATKSATVRRGSKPAPIGLSRQEIDKVKSALKGMRKKAEDSAAGTIATEVKQALKNTHLNPKSPLTSYLKSKVVREVKNELSNKG